MKAARKMTVTIEDVLVAVRKKCMDCCCNQLKVVKACKSDGCPLHPYRCAEEIAKLNIKR